MRLAPLAAALALLAVPAASAAEVLLVPSASAGAVWVVTGNETLVGGNATHAGVVVVATGGTLTLAGATLELPGWGTPCASVNGRLCLPDLLVEPGGRLVVTGGGGVTAAGHALVTVLGALDARDARFERAAVAVAGAEGIVMVERAAFEDAALTVHRGASGVVRDSTFLRHGIYVADAEVVVEGNEVRDASIGIHVATTIVGARCCRAPPTVADNVVVGGLVGIYSDSIEAVDIRGNRVVGAARGITVTVVPGPESPAPGGAPRVVGNVLVDVRFGVIVRSSGSQIPGELAPREPVTVTIRGNDLGGACEAVVVEPRVGFPLRADARWNWWGSADGPTDAPGCRAASGDVDVAPWLVERP